MLPHFHIVVTLFRSLQPCWYINGVSSVCGGIFSHFRSLCYFFLQDFLDFRLFIMLFFCHPQNFSGTNGHAVRHIILPCLYPMKGILYFMNSFSTIFFLEMISVFTG